MITRRLAGLSSPRRTRDGLPGRAGAAGRAAVRPVLPRLGRHGSGCPVGTIAPLRHSRDAGRPGRAARRRERPRSSGRGAGRAGRLAWAAGFGSGLGRCGRRRLARRLGLRGLLRLDARQFFLGHHVARGFDPLAQRHAGADHGGHVLQTRPPPPGRAADGPARQRRSAALGSGTLRSRTFEADGASGRAAAGSWPAGPAVSVFGDVGLDCRPTDALGRGRLGTCGFRSQVLRLGGPPPWVPQARQRAASQSLPLRACAARPSAPPWAWLERPSRPQAPRAALPQGPSPQGPLAREARGAGRPELHWAPEPSWPADLTASLGLAAGARARSTSASSTLETLLLISRPAACRRSSNSWFVRPFSLAIS